MDITKINEYLQQRLREEGLGQATAVEAARWLDEEGLLADSKSRRGRNLRNLLREGRINGGIQIPPRRYGRWWIQRV